VSPSCSLRAEPGPSGSEPHHPRSERTSSHEILRCERHEGELPDGERWTAERKGRDGRIAFVRTVDGYSHLFTVKRDGTGGEQLTFAAENDYNPDWSPDGTEIAFDRCCPRGPGIRQIMVIDVAHGTPAVNISRTTTKDMQPSWNPTGRKLVFSRGGAIWQMQADGTHQKQITHSRYTDTDPSWGDHYDLAFVRCCPPGWNPSIYVRLNGTTTARQYYGAINYGGGDPSASQSYSRPDWSVGSGTIAYQSSWDDPYTGPWSSIKEGGVAFPGQWAYCVDECRASEPAWAPRTQTIALRLVPDDGVHAPGIYTLKTRSDATNPTPVFVTDGSDPAWQPLSY
jgi:hypothetical protein